MKNATTLSEISDEPRVMVDCRCPRCDRIVRGREEVSLVTSLKGHSTVEKCRHCKSAIRLTETNDDLGGYSYEIK